MRRVLIAFLSQCLFSAPALAQSGLWDYVDSTQVNADRVYEELKAVYDESLGTIDTRAILRVDGHLGTTIRLQAPAQIDIDHRPMNELNHWYGSMVYRMVDRGAFIPTHEIDYTDSKGRTFRNTITIKPIHAPQVPSQISKRAGAVIQFTGDPIGPGEEVTLELTVDQPPGSEGEYNPAIEYVASVTSDSRGARQIAIHPSDLLKLATGQGHLRISRYSRQNLQANAPQGGEINASYYASDVYVDIVP